MAYRERVVVARPTCKVITGARPIRKGFGRCRDGGEIRHDVRMANTPQHQRIRTKTTSFV